MKNYRQLPNLLQNIPVVLPRKINLPSRTIVSSLFRIVVLIIVTSLYRFSLTLFIHISFDTRTADL